MAPKETYLLEVIEQTPRLLGLLNRNRLSSGYGCFDRNYWHYNVTDFACARSQEAVLTLALLYKIKNNPYHNNKLILEWVDAALNFWVEIQEKNGSFNEWYAKENSFVATAFSSYAVSETLLQLKTVKNEKVIKALEKAAEWLLRKHEKRAQNQEAGAAIALHNIYLLTKKTKYKKAAKEKIRFILKNQNKEGWFYEYGGADIGYLSLAIDYLAKYYKKTKDKRVLKCLRKAENFIRYFLHPNFTAGGEYGSRNTEYLIPHGFEILKSSVASFIRTAIEKKTTIAPFALDDRYLSYIMYTWLQAYVDAKEPRSDFMFEKNFIKNFPEVGLYIFSNKDFYFIINYNKSCFKIFFKKNKKAFSDSGIEVVKDGKKLTSNWLSKNEVLFFKDKIEIEGRLYEIPKNIMTPGKSMALKTFQMTVGRQEHIGKFVKERLRDKVITKAKKSGVIFRREVSFKKDITVKDFLSEKLFFTVGSKSSYTFVPSSRYFQVSELDNEQRNGKKEIIRRFNSQGDIYSKSM